MTVWGGSLPCDLKSLKDLRRAVDVQFVQLLFCGEDEKDNPYALHVGAETGCPLNTLQHQVIVLFIASY